MTSIPLISKGYMKPDEIDSGVSSYILSELKTTISDQTKPLSKRIYYITILLLLFIILIPIEILVITKLSEWSKDVVADAHVPEMVKDYAGQ
jgi:hypothetical protein